MKSIRSALVYTLIAGMAVWGVGFQAEAKIGDGRVAHRRAQLKKASTSAQGIVCPSCKTMTKRVSYSKDLRKRVHVCHTCKNTIEPGDAGNVDKVHVCERCTTVLDQCPDCTEKAKNVAQ